MPFHKLENNRVTAKIEGRKGKRLMKQKTKIQKRIEKLVHESSKNVYSYKLILPTLWKRLMSIKNWYCF